MRTALTLPAALLLLSGCGPTEAERAVEALPPAYTFDLHATCGERNGLGDFRVSVRDGRTVAVLPLGRSRLNGLGPGDFPSIEDLVARADGAGPSAVVDTTYDDKGVLRSLSIDHRPQAIDDEECYSVSALTAQP